MSCLSFLDMIEILDNYKGADPGKRKYTSDYRAILSWVKKRWEEDHAKETGGWEEQW